MVEIHKLQLNMTRYTSYAVRMLPAASRVCTEPGQKAGMPIAAGRVVPYFVKRVLIEPFQDA
jgi:hypothetical protein